MDNIIKKNKLGNKNKNYLSWDEFFMSISITSSLRSKDPSTQVGACIVDKNNRILSIGYNGTPNGFSDDCFPWDRDGDFLDTKYAYVCHAEVNAILNYVGSRELLKNSTIYVSLFPCNECAKLIIQSGIKNIVYLSDKYEGSKENIASKLLFDECKVTYRKLESDAKVNIDLANSSKTNIMKKA